MDRTALILGTILGALVIAALAVIGALDPSFRGEAITGVIGVFAAYGTWLKQSPIQID
jgi:hypothetical protein